MASAVDADADAEADAAVAAAAVAYVSDVFGCIQHIIHATSFAKLAQPR